MDNPPTIQELQTEIERLRKSYNDLGSTYQNLQVGFEVEKARAERLATQLNLILSDVDYTVGNCRVNEMIGAVPPREIIVSARAVLVNTE